MKKRELGVSIIYNRINDVNKIEHLHMIKDAGFDCFFTSYNNNEPIEKLADEAARIGLRLESLHAPFDHMNSIWLPGDEGAQYIEFQKTRIDMCHSVGADICIMHVTIHNKAPAVSAIGLDRFRELADYAQSKNVRLAFENLEIPMHLEAVLKDNPTFHGFCWDCGHNYCYTPLINMMDRYGDRLICTHIHDNYGVRTPGLITYYDDLHMLPFDGGLNWQSFADQIKKSGYKGPLTLELSSKAKEEYQQMPLEKHYQLAFRAAERLRKMCDEEVSTNEQ